MPPISERLFIPTLNTNTEAPKNGKMKNVNFELYLNGFQSRNRSSILCRRFPVPMLIAKLFTFRMWPFCYRISSAHSQGVGKLIIAVGCLLPI